MLATTLLVAGSILTTRGRTDPRPRRLPARRLPRQLPRMWIVALHLVGLRIDARDRVLLGMGEPDGATPRRRPRSWGQTWMRATTASRLGSIRRSVEVASLIAQTAPSPTVKAPPCGADACPSGVIGMLATSRAVRRAGADPGQRARREAARPDGVPCGGEGESRRAFRRWRDPDRRPHNLARSEVDLGHGSSRRVSGEKVPPGTRQPPGLAADVDGTPDRAKRRRVESTDLAPVAIGEPHLARRDGDPAGKPPTWTRLTDRVAVRSAARPRSRARSSRRGRRRLRVPPPVPVTAESERRVGDSVSGSRRRSAAGLTCSAHRSFPLFASGPMSFGNCERARTRLVRQSSATISSVPSRCRRCTRRRRAAGCPRARGTWRVRRGRLGSRPRPKQG